MGFLSGYRDFVRTLYNTRKRKRLRNYTPTIISRNCISGIIYHDLGLKFNSPTVNLSMDSPDFITFVENLEVLTGNSAELTEYADPNCKWPCGELCVGNAHVRIDFVHYKNFQEAKNKWFDRVARIDYSNLFIIWEYSSVDGPDKKLWEKFESLKYPNKVLITGNRFPVEDEHIIKLDLYGNNYHYGQLLDYKDGIKSYKRYLDDFDYVSFLNSSVS